MVYVDTQLSGETHHDVVSEWLAKIEESRSPAEVALIRKALHLAEQAHVERERPSGEPYLAHAITVANILDGLHMDHEAVAASILHEVLEETDLTLKQIAEQCGESVAHLVDGVQRMNAIGSFHGEQEHDPKRDESLRKLLLVMAADVRVVLIKLADRLHEMRMVKHLPESERLRMAREAMNVYAPLANRLGIWQVKWELEDLAFRHLDPSTYKQVASFLDERRVDRQEYIDSIIAVLREHLQYEGIEADVKGRPKHIYSIWRKMQRKGLSFHELYDIRAVRVLAKTKADCYQVLGIVHSLWPHIPQEFDDYIANPKDNNYQSIHTAVIGPSGKTVEIQIRTYDMEQHAELGVASHWRYKEGGRSDQRYEQQIAWLRQLLDSANEEGSSDGEFIDRFKSEVFKDRVYIITPEGEVVDLPHGATPLDFAYYIHTEVGHRCRGAKINGRIAPLTTILQSGEHVEILTAKEGRPSRDWLNPQLGYLQTQRARNKAKSWFNQRDQALHLSDGKAALDRELQRLGIHDVDGETLAHHMHLSNKEELLVSIGRGDINSSQIASAVHRIQAHRQHASPSRPQRKLPLKHQRNHESTPQITIQGVGNLLTHMASCCTPAPSDAIVGFITVGRGVSIHRQECKNILNLTDEHRNRLIEVEWESELPETFPVNIEIYAFDRHGLLMDIYALLAEEGVNVTNSNTKSDKAAHTARLLITIEVSDYDQLSRVLNRINHLSNIIEAMRRH